MLMLTACSEGKFAPETGGSSNSNGEDPVATDPSTVITGESKSEEGEARGGDSILNDEGVVSTGEIEIDQENKVGLLGGHIDLDTSSSLYPFDQGKTDGHVHEYDDKYDVTTINLMGLLDKKLDNLQALVDANSSFQILVSNAQLSPGASLVINGEKISGGDYRALHTNRVFSLSNQPGSELLSSIIIEFSDKAIIEGGVIPTATGCVR